MANKDDTDKAAAEGTSNASTMLGSAKASSKGGKGKENYPPANATNPAPTTTPAAATNVESNGKLALPFDVNTQVKCKWRNDEYHWVKIIERRKKAGSQGKPEDYEYYVHYQDFNRRLDEWVDCSVMDLATAKTEEAVVETGAQQQSGRTRQQKRKFDEAHGDHEHAEFDPASLREHEEFTKVKNIQTIELGKYEVDTWYFSPFPPAYKDVDKLYFCEFDLAFFKRKEQLQRHLRKMKLRHPPGDEIYRNGSLSMFEVDGKKEKIYCQNLCYLAKLFLDHKTLYYDVDLFLFYILCECDNRGCHVVGYFSKEKASEEGYNLACILTLPQFQRKGYGQFLIAFSYELSKKEQKIGTPERPLSDLGQVSYRSYWTRVLLDILQNHKGNISMRELSDMTMIKTDDVISTLQHLDLIKYQKGQHVICGAPKLIEKHLKAVGKHRLPVDPNKLIWTPYREKFE